MPGWRWLATLLCLALGCGLARADPAGDRALGVATSLIEALVQQGLLTRQRADDILREARGTAADPVPVVPPQPASAVSSSASAPRSEPIHVQYVPEIVRQQLRTEVRADLLAQARDEGWATLQAVPAWTRRIHLDGDLRLRQQFEQFGSGNSTVIPNYLAINAKGSLGTAATLYTDADGQVIPRRDRMLARARLAAQLDATDFVDVGLRLSTGNTIDPVTSNQTLGNYGSRLGVVWDRAFAHVRAGNTAELWAGRMANPFMATELIWSPELGFDGLAASLRSGLDAPDGSLQPRLTVGAFSLQEQAASRHDKWLWGAQMGASHSGPGTQWRGGLGWFAYQGVTGQLNAVDGHGQDDTAPPYLQKGNTFYNIASSSIDPSAALFALAGGYRLLNTTATVDTRVDHDRHIQLSADWVRNIGWHRQQVAARTGIDAPAANTAWLIKFSYGDPDPHQAGDWQLAGSYRRVGADAVIDAFTDTEFHLGGTNAKGYTLGATYAWDTGACLSVKWMSSDEISGPPLAIDVLQLELNLRFR